MKIILSILILVTFSFSDITVKKIESERPDISLPIEKYGRPIRPVDRPVIEHQDNYYNSSYISNCDQYIDVIAQRDEEISNLIEEINNLIAREQAHLQKVLKAKHNAELKKFDERKSSIKSENTITISREPVK